MVPLRDHNKPTGSPANSDAPAVLWAAEKTGSGCLPVGVLVTDPTNTNTATTTHSTRKDKMAILIKEQQSAQAPRYTGCRNDKAKPPYSYASLIAQALLASPNRRLTLASIYAWIMDRYPYYRSENCGWQNSIRHNLSLNRCFVRIARDDVDFVVESGLLCNNTSGNGDVDGSGQEGKGAYWTIDESLMDDFEDGMFKRRKYGQGRAARRQSGEERRRKRRSTNDQHPTAPSSLLMHARKLTIEDELFSVAAPRHSITSNNKGNPMIGLFAPSPGISTILFSGFQNFEEEEDAWFEDEGHRAGGPVQPVCHI